MLRMNIDELFAQFSHLAQGDGRVVDEGTVLLQAALAAVVLGCGLVVLHRERVRAAFQARRRAEAAGRHTAKAPARLKEGCPRKFCA